jgi:Domain of unknown function (DUF4124)
MQRHLMININWLLLALMSGAWLVAAPAAAQTYKWTDADGKVHYSDQPPPANAKEQSTIKPLKQSVPAPTADPAAKAKTYVEQEADFKKRQVEAAERAAAEKKAAEDSAEKKRNCDQVRTQLKGMQAGGRVAQTSAQGEREYMSDAQIAQEIERLKKAEASLCK